MTKRQMFYKSRVWESFVKALRLKRMQPDGTLICEHCGKAITSKYDCIGHHIIELTDDNVDDVMIALNEENVQLVHFRCHNEIHQRFGYGGAKQRHVFIVYGAPCSGKTTWVGSVATQSDLILDIDRIWGAVRAECCSHYDKPDAIKSVVFDLRDTILEDIRTRRGHWNDAYVIGGYPMIGERERIQERIGADKLVYIDTPQEVCMQRAAMKSPEWTGFVRDWFDRYTPDHPPSP